MSRAALRAIITAGSLLAAVGTAWAQGETSCAIAGVVKDTTDAVLPGVTVEAASPALIERIRSAVTDGQGQYQILNLRPGTYTVTFTLPGFSSFKREGLELTTGFTATANAVMRIGAVEETITVSGASPVVDTHNARSQQLLSREMLDTLPTNRTTQGIGAMTLGVSISSAQDVGGNKAELTTAMTIHGSRQGDAKLLIDGMSAAGVTSGGGQSGHNYKINQFAVEEETVSLGGAVAESESAGANINVVPKDGSNTFKGVFGVSGTGPKLQSNNVSAYASRGLTSALGVKEIYDWGGGFGGPIVKDRLWFYTAHRWWGAQEYAPGNYFNKLAGTMFYEPDLSRPAYTDNINQSHDVRLTWQLAAKHKVTFANGFQDNCLCFARIDSSNQAPEAAQNTHFYPTNLTQATWNFVASSRLLFQMGFTYAYQFRDMRPTDGTSLERDIPITEQSTGYVYNADTGIRTNSYGKVSAQQSSLPFSMTYITGSHAFKAGYLWQYGQDESNTLANDAAVNYTFRKATPDALPTPVSITELATPHHADNRIQSYAIYAQQQSTFGRLTLNGGLRFDRLRGYWPAQTRPAGRFVPAIPFEAGDNIPNYRNLNVRMGAAYDVFGNGKTALKWSLGRFPILEFNTRALLSNPAENLATSATRNWNDFTFPVGDPRRGNYVPDCDLTNAAANLECGALTNNGFGTVQISRRFASDVIEGFDVRPYSWQMATNVQQEVRPGVAFQGGYFRTSYGNFRVTQNQAVTPADFDSFCVAVPLDDRLPGGGGGTRCGFTDIKPEAFGRSDLLVTQASHFGGQTEVFHGIDLGMNGRFGRGGLLNGGVSLRHVIVDACALATAHPEVTATTTVSGNSVSNFTTGPTLSTEFCHLETGWIDEAQFKGAVAYPLPWSMQVAATFQNFPLVDQRATYVATNAQVLQSLGRNLGSCRGTPTCTANVTLNGLITPYTTYEKRLTQLDFRVRKMLRTGRARIAVNFDMYNAFNASTILSEVTAYSSTNTWLRPTSILAARLFKFGGQIDF